MEIPGKQALGRAIESDHSRHHPHNETAVLPPEKRPTPGIRTHWEQGDLYPGVIFDVSGHPRWRVVVCKDGLQWILQHREAKDHWEGRKFLATKSRLATVVEDMFGLETLEACKDRIGALPI